MSEQPWVSDGRVKAFFLPDESEYAAVARHLLSEQAAAIAARARERAAMYSRSKFTPPEVAMDSFADEIERGA